MTSSSTQRIALDLYAVAALAGVALVSLALTPFYSPDQRVTLLAHGGLIIAMCGMYLLLVRLAPKRPIHLSAVMLLFGAMQPVALLLATLLQGDVTYQSIVGITSHHRDTMQMAIVSLLFFASFVIGVITVSIGDNHPSPDWRTLSGQISPFFINAAILTSLFLAIARLLLLFNLVPADSVISYVLRLLLGYFLPVTFFLGVGLRRKLRSARIYSVIVGLIYLLVLASGSRADAIVPGVFAFLGAMIAAPLSRRRVVISLVSGLAVVTTAMFVSGLLRGDHQGRTGNAGIERLNQVGARFEAQEDVSGGLVDETIRRYLRNSNHAVLTLIPSLVPFERDGLDNVPFEVGRTLLPGLNVSGQSSDDDLPRNWMLNDLGFLVNWKTSVELSLLADAWYRGGFVSIVTIGFVLGLILQLVERLIYARMRANAEWQFLLLFGIATVWMIEGKDFVFGFHTLIYNLTAGALFIGVVRILSAIVEQPTRATHRRRYPAV